MKYVLMFCGRTPQDAAALEAMSEEARASAMPGLASGSLSTAPSGVHDDQRAFHR